VERRGEHQSSGKKRRTSIDWKEEEDINQVERKGGHKSSGKKNINQLESRGGHQSRKTNAPQQDKLRQITPVQENTEI